MFMIYVLSTFMMLMGFVAMQAHDLKTPDNHEGKIHANHMIAWHNAAVKNCSLNTCSGGSIDPIDIEAYVPDIIRSSPSVVNRNFRTNYDNGSGYVVTYMSPNTRIRAGISYGTVASSFGELIGTATSSSMGIWYRERSQVNFMKSTQGKRFFSVPGDIPTNAMVNVPDGSPVLMTPVR